MINLTTPCDISPDELANFKRLSYYYDQGLAYPLLKKSRRINCLSDVIAAYSIGIEMIGWGAIFYNPTFSWKGNPVLMTYVDEKYRQHGIGTKIVSKLLKQWDNSQRIAVCYYAKERHIRTARQRLYDKWKDRLIDLNKP
jgi:GNAT superfamily N-acetyltransferase